MSKSIATPEAQRALLVLGAYGVLGTGITDAAVADPTWRVVTAGRRPIISARKPPRRTSVSTSAEASPEVWWKTLGADPYLGFLLARYSDPDFHFPPTTASVTSRPKVKSRSVTSITPYLPKGRF
jgi:hypothetical protein